MMLIILGITHIMIRTPAICTRIELSDSKQVSIVYFRPTSLFEFQEWQFMFIEIPGRTRANWKALKNAYSIATTNAFLQKNGEIWFIVKKASEDGVSHFLTQQIQVGYEVMMMGPLGHFVDHKKAENYLMISIWSWVTPIYALYEHLVNEWQEYWKIANIFGERYWDDVLPSIRNLFQSEKSNISHYLCLSREKNLPENWYKGYVQTQLDKALQFLDDLNNTHVFLCGKPVMCDEVQNILQEKWFTKEQFTIEKY